MDIGDAGSMDTRLRSDEICVCCGDYVPEGRQVCLNCEKGDIRGCNCMNSKSN